MTGRRSRKARMHGAMFSPSTPCCRSAVLHVASTWLEEIHSEVQFTTSTSCATAAHNTAQVNNSQSWVIRLHWFITNHLGFHRARKHTETFLSHLWSVRAGSYSNLGDPHCSLDSSRPYHNTLQHWTILGREGLGVRCRPDQLQFCFKCTHIPKGWYSHKLSIPTEKLNCFT